MILQVVLLHGWIEKNLSVLIGISHLAAQTMLDQKKAGPEDPHL